MPVVALLGPRQVGTTTLAIEVSKEVKKKYAIWKWSQIVILIN